MYLFGVIGDIFDLRKMMIITYVMMGISNLALGLGSYYDINSEAYYYMCFAFIGLSSAVCYPNFVSIMSNWFPKKNRGFIIGLWSTCVNVGNIIGI
jgi:MFS family permease